MDQSYRFGEENFDINSSKGSTSTSFAFNDLVNNIRTQLTLFQIRDYLRSIYYH